MLERAVMLVNLPNDMLKVALNEGSSKHGKARLASVGENWVAAIHL